MRAKLRPRLDRDRAKQVVQGDGGQSLGGHPSPPYPEQMAPGFDDRLSNATLSEAERNTVRRFVALMDDALGDDLRGLWLYGSRARGETPREGSDVDLLVIANGDRERQWRLAMDLSEAAALAEGESPFTYSVHVHDEEWLRGRREIESFFVGEVDRDKIVLSGSAMGRSAGWSPPARRFSSS